MQFFILIPNIMPILLENKLFVAKSSKYDLIFGDFATGVEKKSIPSKKTTLEKKAIHTFVQHLMAVRMAYDDRRKVSKPRRR